MAGMRYVQQVRRASEPAGEDGEEVEGRVFVLKGKKESEILFEPGQHLVIGTKQVQVRVAAAGQPAVPSWRILVHTPSSLSVRQLVEPLSADEFKDGTFFLTQCSGHEIRQKAQQLAVSSPTKAAAPLIRIDGPRYRSHTTSAHRCLSL
jgi:hypothetical protein